MPLSHWGRCSGLPVVPCTVPSRYGRRQGVTVHAQALARATGIGNANGCCTRSEDVPALLTELVQKPSSAPAPLAESLRDLDASLLLFPCPATPDTMRHTHRVNACRRLVRRVVLTDSVVSSIRLRKPGSSTLLLLRANPRRRQAALGKAQVFRLRQLRCEPMGKFNRTKT